MKHLLSILTILFVLSCNRYTKILQTDEKELNISGLCLGTGKKKAKKADPQTQTRANPEPTFKDKEKQESFNEETKVINKNETPPLPLKNTAYNYPDFSHPEEKRYLFLDHGGVLDGEIVLNREEITEKDLLLSKEEESKYKVLKNGVQIIEILNKLINHHNFEVYFHANNQEEEQLKMINILQKACEQKGLEFPKIPALFVCDEQAFPNTPSDNPEVHDKEEHGIKIVGYSKNEEHKKCLRKTYAYYRGIKLSAKKYHCILDSKIDVIREARAEGWHALLVDKNNSLYTILSQIYKIILNQPLPYKKKKAIDDTITRIDPKEFIKKEQVGSGSSKSINYYENKASGKRWVGKSDLTLSPCYTKENPISIYKEYLSLKLYEYFGVKTPSLALSEQNVSSSVRETYGIPLSKATHIMSEFVEGFEILGEKFKDDYLKHSKENKSIYYKKNGKPLKDFGRTLAIAKYLFDFDCLGGSGSNMGFIDKGEYIEIVKIDAGEALPYLLGDKSKYKLQKAIESKQNRDILYKNQGKMEDKIIYFKDLTHPDEKEFIQTVYNILTTPDTTLNTIFSPFINQDKRFKEIKNALIERKKNFLNAFSPEIREKIQAEITKLENQEAGIFILDPNANLGQTSNIGIYKARNRLVQYQLPEAPKHFVGQANLVEEIHNHFKETNVVVLCGIGGMGKTHLATQYLYKYINKQYYLATQSLHKYKEKHEYKNEKYYKNILWLYGDKKEYLLDQIKHYMNSKEEQEPKKLMESFFIKLQNSPSLIILDNVEDEAQIQDYLDQAKNYPQIKLLITSRYTKWTQAQKIEPRPFSLLALEEYLKKLKYNHPYEKKDMITLLENLCGLPLGITQSLGYISKENLSLKEYNKLYQNNKHNLLQHNANDPNLNTISTTLTLSLKQLYKKNKKEITNLLSCIAYLSPDHLNKSLLTHFAQNKHITITHGLQLLLDYGFLTKKGPEQYKMHRLTQEVVRLIHKRNKNMKKHCKNVYDWLVPQLNYDEKKVAEINRVSPLIVHGAMLGDLCPENFEQKDLGKLWFKLGYHQIYGISNGLLGKTYLERALKINETHYGPDHPSTGITLTNLGNAYGSLGDYAKAVEYTKQAYTIFKKFYGDSHGYTKLALRNLNRFKSKL